jgi:hypothetical protein
MSPAYSGLRSGTPNPVVCGRKFCAQCGRWRLVMDFNRQFLRGRWRFRAWCRTCQRIKDRQYRAERTEYQRELEREYQRIWREGQRRRAGTPPRRWRTPRPLPPGDEGCFFDAAPLAAELSHCDIAQWALAELAGVPPRAIYRITSGEVEHVHLDTADRIALALDVPLVLLYPDEAI